MKKIIVGALLSASLLSTQMLAADTSAYVGLDVLKGSNTFTVQAPGISGDFDNDSLSFKLKLGYAGSNNWRTQVYFLQETYKDPIFDDSNDKSYELGIDLIKAFEVTPEFLPFVQIGMGYGWMSVDGYSDSNIAAVNAKVGAGVIYKVLPQFELLAGVDYQYKKWQDIDINIGFGTYTLEISEKSFKYYIGANYHF